MIQALEAKKLRTTLESTTKVEGREGSEPTNIVGSMRVPARSIILVDRKLNHWSPRENSERGR
jgi:hypothetical protein